MIVRILKTITEKKRIVWVTVVFFSIEHSSATGNFDKKPPDRLKWIRVVFCLCSNVVNGCNQSLNWLMT